MTNGTEFRGVITDWGGVLTTPILTTVQAWIEADGIDWDSYRTVMRAWVTDAYGPNGTRNPVHALERGECSDTEFEQALAAQLLRVDGGSVLADGSAAAHVRGQRRDSRHVRPDPRGARRRVADRAAVQLLGRHRVPAGRTSLHLFDAVVISGECGMRKPEPEIFRHAADLLGLPPEQCIFIDDIEANITAAQACGMTGVHHVEAAQTAAAVEDLLGISLGDPVAPATGPAAPATGPAAAPATGNTMR